MKMFRLLADAEFSAEDIEDACTILAEHFERLADDPDYDDFLFEGGEIELSLVSE